MILSSNAHFLKFPMEQFWYRISGQINASTETVDCSAGIVYESVHSNNEFDLILFFYMFSFNFSKMI